MEVILLEKIRNLGDIGLNVSVKAGYARNYLIPYGKAVMANEENREKFAKMRAELEKQAAEALVHAKQRAEQLANVAITLTLKATDEGKLFGSVNIASIVEALQAQGITVAKHEISMPQGAIRQLGEYEVAILLHGDVTSKIQVNVVALA